MLPRYFDYVFVHLKQKVRLAQIKPKFLSTLGPTPTRKTQPDLQLCANEPAILNLDLHIIFIRINVT